MITTYFVLQASDYGTMSQSCQSVVPPLNFEGYDMEEYEAGSAGYDLAFNGLGSRFSEITVEERKERIENLINEIFLMIFF